MTWQTAESETWIHLHSKTNREEVVVGVSVTGRDGDMARERPRHADGDEERRLPINRKCD